METVGGYLKQQRMRAGKSLDDVAAAIKVRASLLHELEADHLERLPGGVFLRGYVKSYVRAVGADLDRGMDLLDATLSPEAPLSSTLAGPGDGTTNEKRFKMTHAAILAVVAAVLMAAFFITSEKLRPGAEVSSVETTDVDSGTSRALSPLKP